MPAIRDSARPVIPLRALLLAAVATAGAGRAAAQTVLPDTGTTVEIGSLRQQLEGLLAIGTGGTPAQPGWTVVPSITASQGWSNTGGTGNSSSSWYTLLTPAVLVSANTARLQGTLNYAPVARISESQSGQDQIGQHLNTSTLVTILPEQLFLRLQGFASQQATSGGLGPVNTVDLTRQNTTQSYSGIATPYLRERFGELGTAELGGSYSYTEQNSEANHGVPALNDNTTTTQEYLAFTSGTALERFSINSLASAKQMDGTGVTSNARRDVATVEGGYAITRNITALVKAGYEDIHYSGATPYNVNDAVWSVGTRLTPNPDSTITLRYGHQDGINSATLDASYAPTASTRLYARYSDGLMTALENLQAAVAASELDPLGNPVDPTTGAPLLLTNNFFGTQSNQALYRTKRGSVTGTLLRDRDTFSVTGSYQSRTPLTSTTGSTTTTTSEGVYGSFSWSHNISESFTSLAYIQYGTNSSTAAQAQPAGLTNKKQTTDSLVTSVALRYAFSESLYGSVQYSYTSQFAASGSTPTNLVLVTVRKIF